MSGLTIDPNTSALLVMDFQTAVVGMIAAVVLSTVRHAADADYRLVVVEDCCADRDPELHRVLTEKVFTRHATVTNAEGVVGALSP